MRDWRETRFRLTTQFFERVYAPLLLVLVALVAVGLLIYAVMALS